MEHSEECATQRRSCFLMVPHTVEGVAWEASGPEGREWSCEAHVRQLEVWSREQGWGEPVAIRCTCGVQ